MGLDSSSPISRVVMSEWVRQMKLLEVKNNIMNSINPIAYEKISIHLLKKYVDDVLAGIGKFKLGTTWDTRQQLMVWNEETLKEHTEQKLTEEEVTMAAFSKMSSSIYK